MGDGFETKIPINKDVVLKKFIDHELSRKPLDEFALKILTDLEKDKTLSYYKIELNKAGFERIILPEH